MSGRNHRRLGFALLASIGVVTSVMGPAVAHADVVTLIMGGTGNPDPDETYLTHVYDAYIAPNITPQTAIPTGLVTPEEGFPLSGQLTFDDSVAQGVAILQRAIAAQPSDTHTVVFGFSQSATIVSRYLQEIADGSLSNPPNPVDLSFVLAGNPNNPNGGLFERFDGMYIPGFNETFSGATPDSAYPTTSYIIQYDGFGDFPRYPLNLLADLNALAGLYYAHLAPTPAYQNLTPEQVAAAIALPVSPDATGDTAYYLIPTQTLPLLEPLVAAGAPQWLIDLVNPSLRVLVDLGYGDFGGAHPEYADLPTPASLFELPNLVTVGYSLFLGGVQGVQAALVDVGLLPQSEMPDSYPFVPSPDPGLSINLGQPSETLVSAVTTALGSLFRELDIPAFGSESSRAAADMVDLLGWG